jgi:transposase
MPAALRPAGVRDLQPPSSRACSLARRPGRRAGDTSAAPASIERADERERLQALERENRELRRANEILKSASAFFAAELDRRPSR